MLCHFNVRTIIMAGHHVKATIINVKSGTQRLLIQEWQAIQKKIWLLFTWLFPSGPCKIIIGDFIVHVDQDMCHHQKEDMTNH